MATIREWLDAEGFDWPNGKIVYHEVGERDEEDDYASPPGWASAVKAEFIDGTHPILDKEFDDGYGGPECPRFIATDGVRLYFPRQYDGATNLVSVFVDINEYLDPKVPTPYPGG